MELDEFYEDGILRRIEMKFTSRVNRAGDVHDVGIARSLRGNYQYSVTRTDLNGVSVNPRGNEVNGVTQSKGDFEMILFDTARWNGIADDIYPAEAVVVNVVLTMDQGNNENTLADYTGANSDLRWDLERNEYYLSDNSNWPIFAVYNPYIFNRNNNIRNDIWEMKPAGPPLPSLNAEDYGYEVPLIIVVPDGDWVPPAEGEVITEPYPDFFDYYSVGEPGDPAFMNWFE